MKARICSECGGDVPGPVCVHCGRVYEQMEHGVTHNTDADIIVILDRSGSMSSTRQATIDGYNEFLAEQKKLGGDVAFTLIQFDDQYEEHHKAVRLQNVPELDLATYSPRGSTALYDAIGKTLAGAKESRQTVCVIITDGYENASREWTQALVFAEIEKLQGGKWDFMFLGANQDAFATGAILGISSHGTVTYDPTATGTKGLFRAAAHYTSSARLGLTDTDKSMETLYRAEVSNLDSE